MTSHANGRYSALCLIAALGISSAAFTDTLTVCSSGCDYADLQSAIDDASDGDVIEIAAGTYGSSSDYVETLGKAITIRGAVDSAGEPLTTVAHFFYIWEGETSSTVFENLNCKTQWFLERTNATIRNCVFDDTQRGWDHTAPALAVLGGSDVTVIENCTFRRNGTTSSLGDFPYQSAAGLELSGDGTVSDCLFDRNNAGNYGSAMNCGSGDITVENCTFTDNGHANFTYGGALGVFGSSTSSVAVTDCTFIGNKCSIGASAIYSESYGMDTVRNCLFKENYVTDAFSYGACWIWDVQDSTFCGNWSNCGETLGYRIVDQYPEPSHPFNCYSDTCDDCDGDGVPDGCGSALGNILLVPATYSTIESAVAAACYGDVIEIAAGTYAPAETLNMRGQGLTLRGAVDASGRPATIIDGQGMRGVISCIGESFGASPETRLENLMIVGGSRSEGGGLLSKESNVHLENCIFRGNEGRAIHSRRSTLTVSDCAFESNADGAVRLECGQNLFIGCDFADNAAPQGAGVFCTGWVWEATAYVEDDFYIVEGLELCDDDLGGTTFEACTFASNGPCDEGGGVYVDSFNPIFQNCVFNSGNTERGGAMVVENASPYLEDCDFTGNEALDSGGALLIRGASLPILRQCDFQNNRAGEGGGAIVIENANPQIEDCVFADNEALQSGGAVLIRGESRPILRQCNFHHNQAAVDGGAVVVEATPELLVEWMTFSDCRFTSNTARRGGALANHRQVVGFNSLSLESCTIDMNIAEQGGGVFSGALTGTQLLGSRVRNNHATGGGLGGGLHGALLHAGSHTVANTEFCGNTPGHIMGGWVDNGGNSFLFMCVEHAPGDFNRDGWIDGADLAYLLGYWGDCDGLPGEPCEADINDDGQVNGADLTALLAAWGESGQGQGQGGGQ